MLNVRAASAIKWTPSLDQLRIQIHEQLQGVSGGKTMVHISEEMLLFEIVLICATLLQVALSIAVLNATANDARISASGYTNNVINAVKPVRSV